MRITTYKTACYYSVLCVGSELPRVFTWFWVGVISNFEIQLKLLEMKKMILSTLLMGLGFGAFAQDYYHGFGVQLNYGIYSSQGFTNGVVIPGATYKATLAFDSRRGPSFAASAYPFIGLAINPTTGSYLGAEIPLLAEVHFGDFDDRDFFLGAGFSAAFLASDDLYYGQGGGAILGPQVSVGGQFNLAGRLLGLRLGYTYGVNRNRGVDIYGEEYVVNKNMISTGIYYLLD